MGILQITYIQKTKSLQINQKKINITIKNKDNKKFEHVFYQRRYRNK